MKKSSHSEDEHRSSIYSSTEFFDSINWIKKFIRIKIQTKKNMFSQKNMYYFDFHMTVKMGIILKLHKHYYFFKGLFAENVLGK